MIKSNLFKKLIYLLAPLLISIFFFNQKTQNTNQPKNDNTVNASHIYKVTSGEIGCKELVDDFCTELYSFNAKGNIQIFDGYDSYSTKQGQTENNFDTAWFFYYSSILKNYKNFQNDLRKNIEKRDIPSKIKSLLNRPNKKEMTFGENVTITEFEHEIDNQLSNAIDEVALFRLEKVYPGTYKLTEEERPQEADLEYLRMRHRLWSEISIALWSNSQQWKQVQKDFTHLKKAFKNVIERKITDANLQKKWLLKLDKIQLALPGKNPVTATSLCISTSRNAYYYPYLNTLTVCAGYFNSGGQIQTLAHELSHAFDNSSSLIDFQQNSLITKKLRGVKNEICLNKNFSCNSWSNFKNIYKSDLTQLENYNPDIIDFHRCLQKKKPHRILSEVDFKEKSSKITKERFSDMTEDSSFLRIIDDKLPLPNGEVIQNPNYLNPCAYYLWDNDPFSLDAELFSLIFFTYELRCSKKVDIEKIRNSIAVSKEITESIMTVVLKNEGEFSSREEFLSESLSSPSSERFADRLGSYVVAEYLKSLKITSQKRGRYLVSSFWLCDKPSLRSKNYKLFQSLKDLIVDRSKHAENEERRLDWLSPPIIEQLSCKIDFEENTCEMR